MDEVLINEPTVIEIVKSSANKNKSLGANKIFISLMIQ